MASCGPMTWQALPADPNTPLLSRGASGSVVSALQKGLKKYSTPATDPGPVNGDFGPKTEAAVKAYQQDWVSKRTDSLATRRGGFRRAPLCYSCVAVGTYDGVIRVLGNELGYIKSTACNTLAASV